MIEKLNDIDDILSDIENRLKGDDGDNLTKARGLLHDVINELTIISKGPEPVEGRQYGYIGDSLFEIDTFSLKPKPIDSFDFKSDSWPLNPH